MSAIMAKKKKPGRPPITEPRVAFQVRIPVSLNEALEASMSKNRRLKGTEVQIALEKHLTEQGLWPPPAEE